MSCSNTPSSNTPRSKTPISPILKKLDKLDGLNGTYYRFAVIALQKAIELNKANKKNRCKIMFAAELKQLITGIELLKDAFEYTGHIIDEDEQKDIWARINSYIVRAETIKPLIK